MDGFCERAYEILKESKEKVAFFCTGDMFALELMKFLNKKGYTTPNDFGIHGFDDIDILDYVQPPLYTVYNSVEEVAKESVELLFDLINGTNTNTVRILGYKSIKGKTL